MNRSLSLELPADLLHSARMSLEDMRLELAVVLFQKERVSLGKAASFAGMHTGDFLNQLAARGIGPHFDEQQALEDAAKLARLLPAS